MQDERENNVNTGSKEEEKVKKYKERNSKKKNKNDGNPRSEWTKFEKQIRKGKKEKLRQ